MNLLRKVGFLVANVWVAYHIFCVAIAPVGMPPTSPLLSDVSEIARPYNEFFFLNHGYHYFAPDPGGSTLIQCEVPQQSGRDKRFRFPDVEISPRLLYHRYFMLAENVGAFPAEMQTDIFDAYARHFAREMDSDTITLKVVTHDPSSMAAILQGFELSDPETYSYETLGTWKFRNDGSVIRDAVFDSPVQDHNTARIPFEAAPAVDDIDAVELVPIAVESDSASSEVPSADLGESLLNADGSSQRSFSAKDGDND